MKKQKKQIDTLSNWEWSVLVAAWRYYEFRQTIASATFPEDIIERYWGSGKYADKVLNQIARQFYEIDHRNGEQDWIGLHIMDCDKRPWCKFCAFCKAWCEGFKTVVLDGDNNGKHIHDEPLCFYCEYTKRWYPKNAYITSPYHEISCGEEFIKEIK